MKNLPTDFIKSVLELLYFVKTILKDIEGEEDRYQLSKELLNSIYNYTMVMQSGA